MNPLEEVKKNLIGLEWYLQDLPFNEWIKTIKVNPLIYPTFAAEKECLQKALESGDYPIEKTEELPLKDNH